MIHMPLWVWGGLPALHSPVAPIAARILSSNAGERSPGPNAECGNCHSNCKSYELSYVSLDVFSLPVHNNNKNSG